MISNGTYEYAVKMRRQIHQYPEVGFDLDRTLALVRGELDAMGIPYTEKYGKSSIVATINPDCEGFSIGIRADMDALPIQEDTGVEYASKIPGQMHACGHDAHTAMLLAVAKELKAIEHTLRCKVKLVFTPAEEYIQPGCVLMVNDGVCDEFDCCIACHVVSNVPVGCVRFIPSGGKNANSMGITVEFFGSSAHGASSEKGKDAIAMAVQAYTALDHMSAKEIAPRHMHRFHVGVFQGGFTNNVVADYCKLYCTSRTHSDEITQFILDRTRQIAEGVAAMNGGTAKVTVSKFLPYVLHNPVMSAKFTETVNNHLGEGKIIPRTRALGGEDFGFISRVKPSLQFDLGSGPHSEAHHPKFTIDESCMAVGIDLFTQFVLDHQDGIDFSE